MAKKIVIVRVRIFLSKNEIKSRVFNFHFFDLSLVQISFSIVCHVTSLAYCLSFCHLRMSTKLFASSPLIQKYRRYLANTGEYDRNFFRHRKIRTSKAILELDSIQFLSSESNWNYFVMWNKNDWIESVFSAESFWNGLFIVYLFLPNNINWSPTTVFTLNRVTTQSYLIIQSNWISIFLYWIIKIQKRFITSTSFWSRLFDGQP